MVVEIILVSGTVASVALGVFARRKRVQRRKGGSFRITLTDVDARVARDHLP